MKPSAVLSIVIFVLLVILVSGSLYTVREGQQAVITQFGKPVKAVTEPGLHFKTPFVQVVNRLEKRLLPWDGDAQLMPTREKKRIFINVWARWRISDPMKFFQAVRTEQRGYKILDDLVDSAVRNAAGTYGLIEVVRSSNRELVYDSEELSREQALRREAVHTGRAKMEQEMMAAANADLAADNYGLEIVDLKIKHINYSDSVRVSVIERMKSERDRIAKLYESEAEEEKNKILGQTRKEVDEIEGEREEQSAEIRGRADAEVIEIYAAALSKSPEFYDFLRRLEAYKQTLGPGTRLILSTDSEFLRLLRSPHDESADD